MFPSPDTSTRATPSLQWVPWPPLAGALRFPTFVGLGSEVAHLVARVLATVRRSNRACRFPAHGFHEDSSFRDAQEGIDGDRVIRPVLTVRTTRFINEWTFWGTRRVDPVHQSPRTRAYGFFAKGTVPTSLILAHLVSFPFPTIFAGCLPRPIRSPVARSRGFRHAS
jgi:hypothetical protein